MDTGFPEWDARSDFDRQRRRQALSRIAARLRLHAARATMLPFDCVVAALGRRGEQDLGVLVIPTASVIGSVDRRPESFDRAFRPRVPELRQRWEGIAAARRRGQAMPPIDVYRIGDVHFVRDGHHRVSVARALGETTIEARVREVWTCVTPPPELRVSDCGDRRSLPPDKRDRLPSALPRPTLEAMPARDASHTGRGSALRNLVRLASRVVPVLLMAIVLWGAVAAAASAAPVCAGGNGARPLTVQTHCLINQARARHGARPVRLNRRLALAARAHSRDMVVHRYFSHTSRTGLSPSARIAQTGWMRGKRRWKVGENLAWRLGRPDPRVIVRRWLHSPPHRRVLLARDFRVLGLGIVRGTPSAGAGRGATYTADFGS